MLQKSRGGNADYDNRRPAVGDSYPLRHVSVRVPWHDSGWAGVVCAAPHLNGACTKLKGIAASKVEAREMQFSGKLLSALPPAEWPPCVAERGMFMAPMDMDHVKRHALAAQNP